MYYAAYFLIALMAIRCISYGVSEMREHNFVGGAAAILLALGSMTCGLELFN